MNIHYYWFAHLMALDGLAEATLLSCQPWFVFFLSMLIAKIWMY